MINITKLKCKKCGHEWLPRTAQDPRECPKCKSRDWNKAAPKTEVAT